MTTDKPLVMKIRITPHRVALGSCDRTKTPKGIASTKKSVRTVRVDVAVMNAAVSTLCWVGIFAFQYAATGILSKMIPMDCEIVRAMLTALMICKED